MLPSVKAMVKAFLDSQEGSRFLQDPSCLLSIYSLSGKMLWSSANVTELLGYPRDRFLGMSGYDLVPPEDVPLIREVHDRLADRPVLVNRILDAKGRPHWMRSEPFVRGDLIINARHLTTPPADGRPHASYGGKP